MWLKLLLQLREYLPQIVRLVPLMENFVATRASMPAPVIDLAPLTEVTEGLKNDLGQVTQSHLALSRQIFEANQHLSAELARVTNELAAHQDATSRQVEAMERQLHSFQNWFWMLLALMLLVLALVIALLVVK